VVIVRLDAIGDALTTVPLVEALRARGARTGMVLSRANAGVFSSRALDRVHLRGPHAAAEMRHERYDVALIASEEPEAYALARDAKIPARIGFDNGLLGKPFKTMWIRSVCTSTVFRNASLDRSGLHECEILFKLVQSVFPGAKPVRECARLRPLVIEREGQRGGAAVLQITDKWQRLGAPLGHVVELARAASEREEMVCIGAAAEAAYCDAFENAGGMKVQRFAELAPWKEIIAGARALIAPDSGAMHVAGMTGTPVVGCFAADSFDLQTVRWRPWAAPQRLVRMTKGWSMRAAQALDELLNAPKTSV
jgi:ADP-heptose:LPS heptosyltransferase